MYSSDPDISSYATNSFKYNQIRCKLVLKHRNYLENLILATLWTWFSQPKPLAKLVKNWTFISENLSNTLCCKKSRIIKMAEYLWTLKDGPTHNRVLAPLPVSLPTTHNIFDFYQTRHVVIFLEFYWNDLSVMPGHPLPQQLVTR